jgi:hypothetical protein
VTHHTDVEMDPPGNGAEDINQGNDMEDAPETEPTKQPPKPAPKIGKKRQDQRTGSFVYNTRKAQNPLAIYTIKNDDMERIGYRLRDVA